MNSVTALSANPFLRSIEDRLRERLGDMQCTAFGSEYVAFHASRDEAVRNLLEDRNSGMMIREEAEEYELVS